MLAVEIQSRLKRSWQSACSPRTRACPATRADMADLDDEIAEVSAAYAGAAVTEIATLRAERFGPHVG
jgi:hypothetical protein